MYAFMKTGCDVHKNVMATLELYKICVPMSDGVTENVFIDPLVFFFLQFSIKNILKSLLLIFILAVYESKLISLFFNGHYKN
jgi:hypothetical protein